MTPLEASEAHGKALREKATAERVYKLAECELEEAEATALLSLDKEVKLTVPEKEATVVLNPEVKKWKRMVVEERFNFRNAEAEATTAGECVWLLYGESKIPAYPN